MDLREMGEDHVVKMDEPAKSAWPPWKHLLEDLAEAKPPPTSIKLAYKNLGDAGACRLAELLKGPLRNTTVLDVSCTSIGSSGAAAIAAAVGSHNTLRALDMSSNAVTDGGAAAFAQSLQKNSILQSLCLHACLIGDKGATALADALLSNSTLLELNLRQNYIDDDGASRLANVIQNTKTLRVCDVQSNSYKRSGKAALTQAWAANPRVERSMPLAVSYGGGEEGAEGILARLAQPPRSLVSVDSAATGKSFMSGRKKQGGTPTNLQTTRQAPALSSSPLSPKDKTAAAAASKAVRSGAGAVSVFINKEVEEDDNAKPVRRERSGLGGGSGVGGVAKKVLMAVTGGRLRSTAALRYTLFAAIVLAAVGLLLVSHNRLEAAEESMRAAPPKGGLLFASRQMEVRQKFGVTAAAFDASAPTTTTTTPLPPPRQAR